MKKRIFLFNSTTLKADNFGVQDKKENVHKFFKFDLI